jgi:hypothetical protein
MLTSDLTMSRAYVLLIVSSYDPASNRWQCFKSLSDPIDRLSIFNITVTLFTAGFSPFFEFLSSYGFNLCNCRVPFGLTQSLILVSDCLNCVWELSHFHFFNIDVKRWLVDFVLRRYTLPSEMVLDWQTLFILCVNYFMSVNWEIHRWLFTIFYFMQCLVSQTWHLLNWWDCSKSTHFIWRVSLIMMFISFLN